MENRDRILRILAGLRAKFAADSGCTEAEAVAAMERYNELMQQYNFNETDVHVREAGISKSTFDDYMKSKKKPDIYYLRPIIAVISNTSIVYNIRTGIFNIYGTLADKQYAEFLFAVCNNVIETAWKTYRYSWDYTKLKRQGNHGMHIRNTFRKAVVMRLDQRLKKLWYQNYQSADKALIALKGELTKAAQQADIGKGIKRTALARLNTSLESTVYHAIDAADKAVLQYQAEEQKVHLLEGGE